MKFVSTNDVSTLYEIVVIGGGPTGLAASLSFSQDKITSVLLVESGKEFVQRDRYDPNVLNYFLKSLPRLGHVSRNGWSRVVL